MSGQIAVITLWEMEVCDFQGGKFTYSRLAPGRHLVEMARNPIKGLPGNWWVLAGTSKGARISIWQRHMKMAKKSSRYFARKMLQSV